MMLLRQNPILVCWLILITLMFLQALSVAKRTSMRRTLQLSLLMLLKCPLTMQRVLLCLR